MVPVRAIILAAGSGSRLRPYTADRPKCLLEIAGRTLIEHQIDSLARCGVSDVVMVIGYCADKVRRVIGHRVRFIESVRYRETNSLYSLWEARDELDRGAVVINSDVLAAPLLFERLCNAAAPDAALVDRDQQCDVEEMRVAIERDLVVDFGKDLPPERSHGENVGMIKFGAAAAPRLRMCLERLVASGHENAWSPLAFRELAREWPLHVVATDGLPWIEIDYPEDLERARRDIAPAMLAREVTGYLG